MRKSFDHPKVPREEKSNEKSTPSASTTLSMLSGALVSGLSIPEIRLLTVGEVFSLLQLRLEMLNPKEQSHVRNATQADIDAFLS